jgi:hypothetical protein
MERVEWRDMVTVKTIYDTGYLMLAKMVLEDAEIPYFEKNEGVQDLFGAGRFGTGFNIPAGPVEIQVPREYEGEAIPLLERIDQGEK